MRAKDQIDRIAENSDYIAMRHTHFMIDHSDAPKDQLDIVTGFVVWCIAEDLKDIDVPRGRDGKSYRERAKEESDAGGNDTTIQEPNPKP